MNKVILSGRLGHDPEMRYSESSMAIANFNIATTEFAKGEKKTEWHRIVCFGKTAENVAQYVGKGSLVEIDGRLQTRKWEKDGENRYTTEVVANFVGFLDSRRDDRTDGNQENSGGYSNSNNFGGGSGRSNQGSPNDDIPF